MPILLSAVLGAIFGMVYTLFLKWLARKNDWSLRHWTWNGLLAWNTFVFAAAFAGFVALFLVESLRI